MAITETSIEGSARVRQAWFEESAALVKTMQKEGYDVRGYTWWPLFDFVDWSYASGGRNVEEFVLDADSGLTAEQEVFAVSSDDLAPFLRRMGLVTLEGPDLARKATTASVSFAAEALSAETMGNPSATQ
jgi:hypothetical protein